MKCTFLGNCGLLLECAGGSVLVDAPNGLHTSFDAVSRDEHEKMMAGVPPYEALCGAFFTHKHADHYDRKRVRELTDARPEINVYAVSGVTPHEGVVQCGPFAVRYFTAAHSGAEFQEALHRVLLVECSEKRLYITGDAAWDDKIHEEILRRYRPNGAVWNPNYLSQEAGRRLLECCERNFIYHLPVNVEDSFGFGRKCRTSWERYKHELESVVLVTEYPFSVLL